jgi:two-component system, OmpR family, alkaline phosphatase synthesis response regulator PhoP
MTPNAKILLIDDDSLLLALLERKLTARGYTVATANDGNAGVERARAEHPDLIVLDMMMPIMDGRQTLRAIQADPALSAIPVIMLTSRREESDIVGAIEKGAVDYQLKPFSPDELIARIGRFITKKKVEA